MASPLSNESPIKTCDEALDILGRNPDAYLSAQMAIFCVKEWLDCASPTVRDYGWLQERVRASRIFGLVAACLALGVSDAEQAGWELSRGTEELKRSLDIMNGYVTDETYLSPSVQTADQDSPPRLTGVNSLALGTINWLVRPVVTDPRIRRIDRVYPGIGMPSRFLTVVGTEEDNQLLRATRHAMDVYGGRSDQAAWERDCEAAQMVTPDGELALRVLQLAVGRMVAG